MDSIVAHKGILAEQKNKDNTYNLLAFIGLVGGFLYGSSYTTKFTMLGIYGFAGVGIGGTTAYAYLYANGAYK